MKPKVQLINYETLLECEIFLTDFSIKQSHYSLKFEISEIVTFRTKILIDKREFILFDYLLGICLNKCLVKFQNSGLMMAFPSKILEQYSTKTCYANNYFCSAC